MRDIQLCYILFIAISSTLCHGSISSHPNKFGYKSVTKGVLDPAVCFQEAICEPILLNATCFGTALPYVYTSVALAEDSLTQFDVQDNLAMLEGLKSIPRCWAVVQPLLCSIYMPKCENGSVYLPSQEMCRITRGPCRFVDTIHGWPPFLRCENKKLFPPRCKNPLQEIKFNTTSKCMSPLIETENSENWFYEVEGCGLQCQDPFFTKKEHDDFHHLLSILCTVSFILNLLAVITFIISWKAANRYPGIIVFYINMCLMLVVFGWLIQFFPGAREQIVCNQDGTIRRQQPRSGEHLCLITFMLIYYFLMAAVIWFVILSYAWYITFREKGCVKGVLKKKGAYFHLCAWCIPLLPTVAILAMKEVDGDSMSGICFVGYSDFLIRLGFLIVPISVASLVAFFFLISVLYNLIKVKLNSEEITNMGARKKLRRMILKISVFSFVGATVTISILACHVYDFVYRNDWMESLRDYIVCLAMNSAQPYSNVGELPVSKCVLKDKPSVGTLRLQLICQCLFCLIMFSWIVTRASVEAWKRFFFRLCAPAERNANTFKKHELISKIFQRRHQINQGNLSFSLNSTHDDPVGMNLDINSIASRDISSSWAIALPQFIMRRNAVAGIDPITSRHYSSASDISRHISVDSYNQQNLDSLSMQISEQDYAHALRHQRRKTRKERERFLRANRIAPWFPGNRRGSDTSLQSSLMTASIVASANKSLGANVTKSTSTGDLGVQAALQAAAVGAMHAAAIGAPMQPTGDAVESTSAVPTISHRNMFQREKVKPPFTHGMNGTCGLDPRNPRIDCRNVRSSVNSNVNQRFTPYPSTSFQNPMGGIIRPPMYGTGYDMMNFPFGYLGSGMYPGLPGMYPGYSATNFNYAAYGASPYLAFGPHQSTEALYQYHNSLIPLQPRVESASETEYLPIIMSDSEYTDTGMRSYDEAQLLSACLMQQERLQAQAIAAACVGQAMVSANSEAHSQIKSTLEPQAPPHLLKMLNSNAKVVPQPPSRPASGKKTPHSDAPPPSPADSLKSLNMEDDKLF